MSTQGNSHSNVDSEISRVQLTSFTNSRGLGPEKLDPVIIQECAEIVVELNQETAVYCTLVVYIGGTQDSEDLRQELKRIRLRGLELAQLNKLKLIPLLRNTALRPDDTKELERQYNMFAACLELLEIQLIKTLALQQGFPLHNGTTVLINTGITEPFVLCKQRSITVENLECSSNSKGVLEQEEMRNLERDIHDLHDLIYYINQSADVNLWADIEPPPRNADKPLHNSTSLSGSADTAEISVSGARTQRLVCIMVLTFSGVAISAVVIGVTLGLL